MPLPNLAKMVPTFKVTIPSSGKEVTFRPFLVKEEKLLLIALEAGEEKTMLDAMVEVVKSCALTPIKVDTLANFDLEYIFLQLRARSVNEVIELAYKCHNKVPLTGEEFKRRFRRDPQEGDPVVGSCDNIVKIKLNLDDVKIQFNEDHTKQIFLTETMGVNMRYPNCKMAKFTADKTEALSITDALQRLAMCIESIFDGESVYTNFTPKDLSEWIDMLTQTQFLKIQEFFETIPKLAHDLHFECPKCGYEETIHVEGLENFFV
jgi:T4 bacteriophage base plate protein